MAALPSQSDGLGFRGVNLRVDTGGIQLLGEPKDVERRPHDLDRNCDGGDDDGGPAGPGAPYLVPTSSWTVQVSTACSVNDQCGVPRRAPICPPLLRRCVLLTILGFSR